MTDAEAEYREIATLTVGYRSHLYRRPMPEIVVVEMTIAGLLAQSPEAAVEAMTSVLEGAERRYQLSRWDGSIT